jgi:hypothetical protein
MYYGLLDPDPSLHPDPSINKQKNEEKSGFLLFCDFFCDILFFKNDKNGLQKGISMKTNNFCWCL